MSLTRICIHWDAGDYKIDSLAREHYHFIIDGDGVAHEGKYKPEDNLSTKDGKYAAHCGGGNTGAIGVALCGMYGFNTKAKYTPYPLREKQCEAAWKLVAQLCKKYGIPISPDTVYTHYEFGKKNPKTVSAGKIDIVYLPFKKDLPQNKVGDYIRNKIQWYLDNLGE